MKNSTYKKTIIQNDEKINIEFDAINKRRSKLKDSSLVVSKYHKQADFKNKSIRINKCCDILGFGTINDNLKVVYSYHCHCRTCPNCIARREMILRAQFYDILPNLLQDYPTSRFLFLTLTVKNCDLSDLRITLKNMNLAWNKLCKRKFFRDFVIGWVRTSEVTRSSTGQAHPHFHILLMVKSTYFNGSYYLTNENWAKYWQEVNDFDYLPQTHIKVVKGKENLYNSVLETIKYSIKPSDLVDDFEFWKGFENETSNLRFFASGGIIQTYLKSSKLNYRESNITDFIDDFDDKPDFYATFNRTKKSYEKEK